MRKKDRSPYSFRRKQSLNYLANLSSRETSWFGLCAPSRARANDARNYAQSVMRNAKLKAPAKRGNIVAETLLFP